jgi:hypothetical protein
MRIKRQVLLQTIVGLCVLWITAGLASAQSFQGGLRGSVKDAQGVIPGVTVTLLNEANGVTRDTVSTPRASTHFPAVDPSTYTCNGRRCRASRPFERQGHPHRHAAVRHARHRARSRHRRRIDHRDGRMRR